MPAGEPDRREGGHRAWALDTPTGGSQSEVGLGMGGFQVKTGQHFLAQGGQMSLKVDRS